MKLPINVPATDILNPKTGEKIGSLPAFSITKSTYSVVYNNEFKIAQVIGLHPRQQRPLILWQGSDYDAVGQFDDAKVDARITELLGANPGSAVASLM